MSWSTRRNRGPQYANKLARRISRANGVGPKLDGRGKARTKVRRKFGLVLREAVAEQLSANLAARRRRTGAQKRRARIAARIAAWGASPAS